MGETISVPANNAEQKTGLSAQNVKRVPNEGKTALYILACMLFGSGAFVLFGDKLASPDTVKTLIGGFCIIGAAFAIYSISRSAMMKAQLLREARDSFEKEVVQLRKEEEAEKADLDDHSANLTLLRLTLTDKLTGLGNKQRLHDKFGNLSSRAILENRPFCMGLVNIDGMKPINDLFGNEGGDDLIKQCSMRLRAAMEEYGFVYRHEGDEFGLILPDAATEKEVLKIGKVLQDVLLAPFDINNTPVRVSGSFGFAIFPDAGENFEKVMANIETALYHSKRRGRGRVTIYSGDIEKTVRENAIMEQALRRAISDNAISPHFQPIISLEDGKLLGFESLARWIDPELGFVSPAKFITLAEERGIIAQLTEALLLKAAQTAADWPEDMFLSFNLSSTQLVDPTTAENILETIRRAGLPPRRLEIEVTETAMMSDPETAAKIIEELHDAGVRISMDDFGTGQSSLGRLRELKLDKVKIDRAFIMAIGEDKPAEHIVRAILEMCAGLDLTVVAEGIEEIEQAESLKRFGCHAGQGYLFGKPQDANKTAGYIREFRKIAQSDRQAKTA